MVPPVGSGVGERHGPVVGVGCGCVPQAVVAFVGDPPCLVAAGVEGGVDLGKVFGGDPGAFGVQGKEGVIAGEQQPQEVVEPTGP